MPRKPQAVATTRAALHAAGHALARFLEAFPPISTNVLAQRTHSTNIANTQTHSETKHGSTALHPKCSTMQPCFGCLCPNPPSMFSLHIIPEQRKNASPCVVIQRDQAMPYVVLQLPYSPQLLQNGLSRVHGRISLLCQIQLCPARLRAASRSQSLRQRRSMCIPQITGNPKQGWYDDIALHGQILRHLI